MRLARYCSQTILSGITFDSIEKVPGRLNDRKTPLGELNWIFTAITDTIAWNVLPADLFQKLFRQVRIVAFVSFACLALCRFFSLFLLSV